MDTYDYYSKYGNEHGIDYDLYACLEFNPQPGLDIQNIDKVLAVHEGERDEEDWQWIIRLIKKVDGMKYVYLVGGCDYTGWD